MLILHRKYQFDKTDVQSVFENTRDKGCIEQRGANSVSCAGAFWENQWLYWRDPASPSDQQWLSIIHPRQERQTCHRLSHTKWSWLQYLVHRHKSCRYLLYKLRLFGRVTVKIDILRKLLSIDAKRRLTLVFERCQFQRIKENGKYLC